MRTGRSIALGVFLIVFSATARSEDWPQFRGPSASGLTTESQLPTEWSAEKNVKWKSRIPGVGWSSPVVWGDKVFVTTAITENQVKPKAGFSGGRPPGGGGPPGGGDKGGRPPGGGGPGGAGGRGAAPPDKVYRWEILCLDRSTGKELWNQLAIERKPTIATHSTNSFASETPVSDCERLYVYFGMTGLFCYDLAGTQVWKKDLGSFPMQMGWGTGSSPVLEGDRLFLQCDNEQKSFLVAFDKKTGSELWRIPRDERSTWSTPYVWKNKERTELVTAGTKRIRAYDPATGKVLWEFGGLSNGRCSATPVGDSERLFTGVGGGRGTGPLFAVKAGAK